MQQMYMSQPIGYGGGMASMPPGTCPCGCGGPSDPDDGEDDDGFMVDGSDM